MTLQISEPRTKRWTREEYYQLADQGYFHGQRVQLIDGEIIQMAPQGHEHATCVMRASKWLYTIVPDNLLIRVQMPLNALERSDPEPDLAVIPGPMGGYTDHPQTALLAIEVSDTSLRLDRRKASLYAAAGVGDYSILNIKGRCIEVHRDPVQDGAAEFGFRYASVSVADEEESISPLAIHDASVKVRDLLP
jgi:Uma2 family endonuclease